MLGTGSFTERMAASGMTRCGIKFAARQILEFLLSDDPMVDLPIVEARVYRSPRSRIWQATYTSAEGGQEWRSTGLTDKAQALRLARQWERDARAERERRGRLTRKPLLRAIRQCPTGEGIRPLTQEEVALVLKLSVRSVRAIEKRAVRKLMQNSQLRQVWAAYLAGELDEDEATLTQEEIEALFALAYTAAERRLLRSILSAVQP